MSSWRSFAHASSGFALGTHIVLLTTLGTGVVACTSEPRFGEPTDFALAEDLFVVFADNPTLGGFVATDRDDTYSSQCPDGNASCRKYLQYQYEWTDYSDPAQSTVHPTFVWTKSFPWDSSRPNLFNTSQQRYGGEFVPEVWASKPVFNHGMKKLEVSPFDVPTESGASVETWVPDLRYTLAPWVMALGDCDNYDHHSILDPLLYSGADPKCSGLRGRTFPFFAGSINMPRDEFVTFGLWQTAGMPPTGAIRAESFENQDTIRYAPVNSGLWPVVPIHVHVFTNTAGTNEFGGFRITDAASAQKASLYAQGMFDYTQVSNEPGDWVGSADDWVATRKTKLNDPESLNYLTPGSNPDDYPITRLNKAYADQWFERCGISTRLESFSVIRQSEGLEQEIALANFSTLSCIQPTSCSIESGSHFSHPIGKYILAAHASMANQPSGLPQGVHIFVFGGWEPVYPQPTLGCACKASSSRPSYILFGGNRQNLSRSGAGRTAAHELSHVLGALHAGGLSEEEEDIDLLEDSFTALPQQIPFPTTQRDNDICATMRTTANAFFGDTP